MTDFRELCARMADELDHYRQLLMDDRRETHALAAEARAALAQPEPVAPSLNRQALGALGRFNTNTHTRADEMTQDFDLIRRALEALDD